MLTKPINLREFGPEHGGWLGAERGPGRGTRFIFVMRVICGDRESAGKVTPRFTDRVELRCDPARLIPVFRHSPGEGGWQLSKSPAVAEAVAGTSLAWASAEAAHSNDAASARAGCPPAQEKTRAPGRRRQ